MKFYFFKTKNILAIEIRGNLSKLTFFEGMGHFEHKFQTEGGIAPTTVGVVKLERLPFFMVSKYSQCIVWLCYKACVSQTDGRTDGQNNDSQHRASIAASRSKMFHY